MLKNNKGFMLIEVIVTSTIVVTTMIALYSGFIKLYNTYKQRNSYYNIDATYATKEMINAMLTKNKGNINEFIYDTFNEQLYGYIIKKDGTQSICKVSTTNCDNLKALYSIENMILSEYDSDSLKTISEINQTFKEYIDYIINYYDIPSDLDDDVGEQVEKYSYIMITETKENDKYYYASLRVR